MGITRDYFGIIHTIDYHTTPKTNSNFRKAFMKKKKSVLFISGLLLVLAAITYKYVIKDLINKNKYGVSVNSIREYVKIPTIEENMKKDRNIDEAGAKWLADVKPNGLCHVWKIVSYNNGKNKLGKEYDMFRKFITNEDYWQLNMSSKVFGDSASKRRGILRRHEKETESESVDLDDKGLDSLFISWQLDKLVKK